MAPFKRDPGLRVAGNDTSGQAYRCICQVFVSPSACAAFGAAKPIQELLFESGLADKHVTGDSTP